MKRFGSVIELIPEKAAEYRRLHDEIWPDVVAMIRQCHLNNYSIFQRKLPDEKVYLFSYYEYVGHDYATDMAKMAADPTTQKWWDICKPCHTPLPDRAEGEWWAGMEEVFHCD